MEQGVEVFCPASANCPINQRTGLILKTVSDVFHEKALKLLNVKSRYPVNLVVSAEYSLKGLNAPDLEGDLKASPLKRNSPSKSTTTIDNNLPLEKSNASFRKNGISAKLAPTSQEKIDPKFQPGLQMAAGLTASEPRLYPASPDLKYAALFESVVYPAIAKSKNRYKDRLPGEDLDTIGKNVSSKCIDAEENEPPEMCTDPILRLVTKF